MIGCYDLASYAVCLLPFCSFTSVSQIVCLGKSSKLETSTLEVMKIDLGGLTL